MVLLVGTAAALVAIGLQSTAFFQTIEGKTWDWRTRHLSPKGPPPQTVLLLVDEATLQFFRKEPFGLRWPFPREVYCPVLAWLKHAGAKKVLFDIQFSEPDEFDEVFAGCIADHGDVTLAFQCVKDEGLQTMAPPTVTASVFQAPQACRALMPVESLRKAAKGFGRIDMEPDPDGVLRWTTPLIHLPGQRDQGVPSLGLAAALTETSDGKAHEDVPGLGGGQVERLGHWLRGAFRALVRWRAPEDDLPVLPFHTAYARGVLLAEGKESPGAEQVRGKVVFIGTSAAATYDLRATAASEGEPGVKLHANFYEGLRTDWTAYDLHPWEAAVVCVLLAFLVAACASLLPRIWLQVLGSALSVGAYLALAAWAFRSDGAWLPITGPMTAALSAFAIGATVNYALEGRRKGQIRQAFAHYLAPAVVEQLVRDPDRLHLGGERREITAFFSDIQGFTSIAEQLDPADLVALLNECLGAMTEIILEEGGTIDKYIGDAIVAMFGAPLDQPDHADRACRAALRCQAVLQLLREQAKIKGRPELHVRIGLNSGVALVGNMGSRQRFDYTMMGDTVNLAARLEGASGVYGVRILCGEGTALRCGDGLLLRELDAVRVKGKRQPVRVFEVMALADQATSEQRHKAVAFAAGLQAWRQGRLDDAARAWEPLAEQGDPAAVKFLDRLAKVRRDPLPADWDGVHELTSK